MASDSRGKLVVIAAPSGAGKTTLVRALLKRSPSLEFSISYTTRRPRSAEEHGKDYFFVDEPTFDAMRQEGEFLESASVFDHWYGTSRTEVERSLVNGRTVLLEIDWQGAQQIRANDPDAVTIFVLPPSRSELERRLRGRRTDPEPVIARRLADAVDDMGHWQEFDYVVVNDAVEPATDAILSIIEGRGESLASSNPATADLARRVLAN